MEVILSFFYGKRLKLAQHKSQLQLYGLSGLLLARMSVQYHKSLITINHTFRV